MADEIASAAAAEGAAAATSVVEGTNPAPAAAAAPAGGEAPKTGAESTSTEADAKAAADAKAEADAKAAADAKADAKAEADAKAAQEAVDAKVKEASEAAVKETTERLAKESAAKLKATQDGWIGQSKADPEFGGEAFDANLAIAQKSLDLMPDTFKTFLDASRLGDHPEVIRWMYRVGKMMSSPDFVPGGKAPAASQDLAKRLYPEHP